MFAARTLPKIYNTVSRRNSSNFIGSIVSGPPAVKISAMEKFVLGGAMIGSFLIIPAWVLGNLENYKAR